MSHFQTPHTPVLLLAIIAAVLGSGHVRAQNPAPTPEPSRDFVEVSAKFLEISEDALKQAWDKNLWPDFVNTLPSHTAKPASQGGLLNPLLSQEAMSVHGVFTEEQLAKLLENLDKKANILSVPKVVVRSGRKAIMRSIREYPYPTEYRPNANSPLGLTPLSFETRNVGITIEVEPTVNPDGITIDLDLVPELVELTGFVKLNGQPVTWTREGLKDFFNPPANIFPKDEPVQPIFSTRKVQTAVTLYSGQALLLGGLKKAADAGAKSQGSRTLFMIVQVTALKPDGTPVSIK